MVSNVEFASDPSLSLNGKEQEEYTKEHVFANPVVKTKIFAKSVH